MDDDTCCVCGSPTGAGVIHTEGQNYCSFDCVVRALTPEQRTRLAKLMGPIGKQPRGES